MDLSQPSDAESVYITGEHLALREQVARFLAREVEPHAAAWEEQGHVPREVLRQMGALGLLGITAGASTLSHAIDGLRRFQMPFWDAMLWATAQEAGVSVLLTGGFQDLGLIEGVRFVNPFSHPALTEFLA